MTTKRWFRSQAASERKEQKLRTLAKLLDFSDIMAPIIHRQRMKRLVSVKPAPIAPVSRKRIRSHIYKRATKTWRRRPKRLPSKTSNKLLNKVISGGKANAAHRSFAAKTKGLFKNFKTGHKKLRSEFNQKMNILRRQSWVGAQANSGKTRRQLWRLSRHELI